MPVGETGNLGVDLFLCIYSTLSKHLHIGTYRATQSSRIIIDLWDRDSLCAAAVRNQDR